MSTGENTYDVYNVVADTERRTFTDAKEAGAAFFELDRTKRPAVIHTTLEGGARFMASTDIVDTYANGEQRFVKRLPSSHEVDADFRAGYMKALERSVDERLKGADWEQAKPAHSTQAPNLDPSLYDDLETLSWVDPDKATKAWADHAPTGTAAPAFIDPEWKK